MKAIYKDQIIAESNNTIEVDGYRYFPKSSIKEEFLEESEHNSICPWKGEASYYHVKANGDMSKNAAWEYPNPKGKASFLEGYIGFWKDIKIER
ncbi:DUF427 domain-containing protein [Cytophagaceae bacterium ABcell3]|nr:DUF427 domain-containing protein [Cytophagaceae bacterium ABcell3]